MADETETPADEAEESKPEDEAEAPAPDESTGTDESPPPESAEDGGADEDAYVAAIRRQQAGPSLDYEAQMDVYPLREADEDPRWAIWLAKGWALFAIASILFILVLLVLGAIYD